MDFILYPLLVLVITILIVGLFKFKAILQQVEKIKYQNKLLQALRHLDVVTLSITDVGLMCQEIVNVVQRELGFFFGAVALIDEKNQGLKRIAISNNTLISKTLKQFSISYSNQLPVSLSQQDNLLIKSVLTRSKIYTGSLHDIQIGVQPKKVSDDLQKQLGMKGFFVYPLITKDKIIGVIYYCTLISPQNLSKFEYDIMEEFTREVTLALNNVLLYQSLRNISLELQRANERLRDLDRLKDEFVSLASHELRTPLTAISSYLYMVIYKSKTQLPDRAGRYLTRAFLSTERLINLVNDMLNVSRIESGRIEITPKAFSISELVKDVIDEVKPKADETKVGLYLLDNKPPFVFADNDKVHQVLLNLIGNAVKFTPSSGNVSISFFSDGKVVEVVIKDNGVGISKVEQAKLFQKFGRLDSSYLAMGTNGGTGLGLYISKRLIELMRGRIWAFSEGEGKGSTFTFALPVATQEMVSQAAKFAVKPRDGGAAKGLEPVII